MDPPADSMIRKRAKVNEDFPGKKIMKNNTSLISSIPISLFN